MGVRSERSRRMIRKLAWEFPKDDFRDQEPVLSTRERLYWTRNIDPAIASTSNLENVVELHIFLDAVASWQVVYPLREEVEQEVEEGILPEAVLDDMVHYQHVYFDAACYVRITKHALTYITHQMIPSIRKISFNGVKERVKEFCSNDVDWHGLPITALPEQCSYLRLFKKYIEDKGKVFEYGGVREEPGRCWICMSEWTEDHWSLENDLNICPGLDNVEV